MLSLKKVYGDELLQLALVLSLLRVDPDNYLGLETRIGSHGLPASHDGWAFEHVQTLIRPRQIHPKSLDSMLLSYERHLFEDLNSLGRYQRVGGFDVQTYLLNVQADGTRNTVDLTPEAASRDNILEPETNQEASNSSDNHTEFDLPHSNEDLFMHFNLFDQELLDLELNDFNDVPSLSHLNNKETLDLSTAPIDIAEVLEIEKSVIKRERASTSFSSNCSSMSSEFWKTPVTNVSRKCPETKVKEEIVKEEPSDELTQEDMDLIEVLWKQDVDLGFSLEASTEEKNEDDEKAKALEAEKLKVLQNVKKETTELKDDPPIEDPWAGLSYTIDMETGEYVLKQLPEGSSLPLEDFLLEEALQLAGLEDPQDDSIKAEETSEAQGSDNSEVQLIENNIVSPSSPSCSSERGTSTTSGVVNATEEEDLDILCDMIQTAQFNHAHPRSHHLHHGQLSGAHAFSQPRMPLSRSMSMEQRWQDFASSFLTAPPPSGQHLEQGPAPGAGGYHPHHGLHPHHHGQHQPSVHGHHSAYSAFASPAPPVNSAAPNGSGYHIPSGGVLLHNATLAPPMGDLNPGSYGGTNLGSAVTSSMHLTNTSEAEAIAGNYKAEGADMLYYQNSSIDGLNQTTDGFLNSILNDEDLQLMDMAVNEGMYTMRMLDAAHQNGAQAANNNVLSGGGAVGGAMVGVATAGAAAATTSHGADRMDASSDSAVSSMGSERVPSLSDGEWGENGSDSAQDYHHHQHHSKYSPYDYSYNTSSSNNGTSLSSRQPPVAQKKHHMFARRYFQEQNSPPSSATGNHLRTLPPPLTPQLGTGVKFEYDTGHYTGPGHMLPGVDVLNGHKTTEFMPEMKYSCTMDFARQQSIRASYDLVSHNHTYHMPPHMAGATPRPQTRDKKDKKRGEHDEHLTRDEKRARALNVPIQVHDIINLPMDEFNERLSKHDLTESQLSLIRDIRRRGKNKVAAQNCRKRKLDQIVTLADEVKDMRERKHRLLRERDQVVNERQRIKDKFAQLYRHVFQNLRDSDGNPYSQFQYSLQQSADGSVVLVPRSNNSLLDHQGSITNSTNDSMDPSRPNNNLHRPNKE